MIGTAASMRCCSDSWSLLDTELQSAALRLGRAARHRSTPTLAAAVAGVDAAALDRLREHSWLARSDDGRLAMHPLQREFVQRRSEHDAALRRDIDEALARHVRAVLAPAPPFADVGSSRRRRARRLQRRGACIA